MTINLSEERENEGAAIMKRSRAKASRGPSGRRIVRRRPVLEEIEGRQLLSGMVSAFPLPTSGDYPTHVAAGADGNVWITEAPDVVIGVDYIVPPDRSGPIARVAPDGAVTEFALPAHVIPGPLAAGPDGAMWFAETMQEGGKLTPLGIDRITTGGAISAVPNTSGLGPIGAMTSGPDGSVWVVAGSDVDRISAAGVVTQFAAGKADGQALAASPDGSVWFTESTGVAGAIGHLTPGSSAVASFPLPSAGVAPQSLAVDGAGNAWFTESVVGSGGVSRIGRASPAGAITEFPLDVPNSYATGISAGPDGALYFVENSPGTPPGYANPVNAIGRITTDGAVSDIPLSGFGGVEGATTIGPNGNLWFGEFNVAKIGEVALDHAAPSTPPRVVGASATPSTARGALNRVVLTFDGPLDPSRAASLGNYALAALGRAGRRGHRAERPVHLVSATYDAAARTVTLRVRGVLQAGRPYRVTLNAAPPQGLVGSDGIAPAGDATGHVAVPFSPSRPRARSAR